MTAEIMSSVVDRIKQTMVALKMPSAIEILDATVRRLDHGEMTALEAIDALLAARLGGMKWNWIFELGGIAAVSLGAYRVAPVTVGRDAPIWRSGR